MNKHLIAIAEALHQRFFRTPMSEDMRAFVVNLGVFGFATVITGIILFLVNVFAGRILGPDEYGKYALILSLGQFFIIPMNFGLTTSIIKFSSSEHDPDPIVRTGAYAIFLFTAVSTVFIWLLRVPLQRALAVDSTVYIFTLYYSVVLIIKYLAESILRGLHQFRRQSVFEVVSTFSIALAFFGLWRFGHITDFRLYIGAIMIGFGIYAGGALWKERRRLLPLQLNRQALKLLLGYGIFTILGSIAGFVLGNIDRLMIHWYLTDTQVGIYSAYSSASVALLGQLMLIFLNVFFPTVSRAVDHRQILKKFQHLYLMAFVPLLVLSAGLIWVVISLFGKNYPLQWSLLLTFSLNAVIYLGSTIQWWLINATGIRGAKFTSFNAIVAGLINIALNWSLIRWFGINGAVISTIFASCYFFVMTRYFFVKIYPKLNQPVVRQVP